MSEPAVVPPTPAAPDGTAAPTVPVVPTTPAAPVEPTPAAPPADWRAGLPTDLQAHPSLTDTKSVESLARQYIDQNKFVGAKGIVPPVDDSPEEQTRYLNALGRPESPDLYKFDSLDLASRTPETIGFLDSLRPSFHARGLTDKQADGITKDWLEAVAKDGADKDQAHAERAKITTADLNKKWGLAADARHEMAKRAVNYLFGEEAALMIAGAILPDGSRVGDNPGFIENLYENLGQHMTEDQLTVGSSAPSQILTPEGAQAEIDKLMLDKDFTAPYYDTNHSEHKAAQDKMKALYAQVNPPQRAA